MTKIIRRVLTILPAVLLQVLWFAILFTWLAPWAELINTILTILSFLFVLYLITKQEEGTYKILWLLVILPFPISGAALYLFFGNKRTTKPLRKKLDAVRADFPSDKSAPEVMEALAAENGRMAQTFRFVEGMTGFATRYNRGAVYYPLGDVLFPEMLEALKSAKQFIYVEYFIVENGLMWDSMVEIMSQKAAEGVDVRVMYDDLGSISTYTGKNMAELWKKGIHCIPFNPLIFVKGTLNYRDHRKMLIVDGRIAFSGGVNLADEYINHIEKHGHWKDIGFRITGEAVGNFTRMYLEFWNAFSNEPIPAKLPKTAEPLPSQPIQEKDGFVLSYYDSPLRSQAASNELYVDLLSQAENYAWFFTPYLMPGEALLDAFVRAAGRGVDVRIIMPGIPDKKLVFRMSNSFYPVLLEAGVKIYEYTPGFVHAKGCMIDDKVCTIGTVNLDYRSLFLHFENNSLFYRASIIKDMKADFLETQSKCQEKTLDDMNMGFFKWLVNGILRIFAPLC